MDGGGDDAGIRVLGDVLNRVIGVLGNRPSHKPSNSQPKWRYAKSQWNKGQREGVVGIR